MVDLRPLIVVTGTARVEGGERNKVRYKGEGTRQVVTVDRQISDDRRAANVIATDHMRRLRGITLLRTPYGVLVDPARLPELKGVLKKLTDKVVKYNSEERQCALTNCVLWEHLKGQRLTAIAGWIDAELAKGDEAIKKVLPELIVKKKAA